MYTDEGTTFLISEEKICKYVDQQVFGIWLVIILQSFLFVTHSQYVLSTIDSSNTYLFSILLQFQMFIHSQKRNPQTHLKDPNMVWDFFASNPQATHQVVIGRKHLSNVTFFPCCPVSILVFGSRCTRWFSFHARLWLSYIQNGQ